MPTAKSLWNRYRAWREEPSELARGVSGLVQTIMVFLWCSMTLSTGLMAHLDYDLRYQLIIHIQNTVILLGLALLAALAAPTRSWLRWAFQTLAIGFSATMASLATVAFNPM
ncbi:hypothetical protein [Rhizobium sp. BK176]|uniref:hypothetical protein n=1 Tax=Rhizobium sp. BK176 TaxID=2587071 RepID=UPI002166F038|nr:hypothetical protein [Rhizobium sp. BK176]MCS4089348.1 hypothetical protein [Rhizobium sp. BK176]